MNDAKKVIALRPDLAPAFDDSRMLVTMTVAELRQMIAEAIRTTTSNTAVSGLMDVDEAAKFVHQSATYVYRNWREMGGRKLGKNLRFTRAGLERWINSKGA